jgi:putative component of membrane protein insertase Oxa1/YidC/SpoIIIJ protein YidD
MRRVALLVTLALATPARADDGPFDAPGHPVTRDAAAAQTATSSTSPPLSIWVYRELASFQGPRCQHRPSCSAYAAEAMNRHGPFLGSFIGVSRLLRGERSSAIRLLDRDARGGLIDPLEAATFFLTGPAW